MIKAFSINTFAKNSQIPKFDRPEIQNLPEYHPAINVSEYENKMLSWNALIANIKLLAIKFIRNRLEIWLANRPNLF